MSKLEDLGCLRERLQQRETTLIHLTHVPTISDYVKAELSKNHYSAFADTLARDPTDFPSPPCSTLKYSNLSSPGLSPPVAPHPSPSTSITFPGWPWPPFSTSGTPVAALVPSVPSGTTSRLQPPWRDVCKAPILTFHAGLVCRAASSALWAAFLAWHLWDAMGNPHLGFVKDAVRWHSGGAPSPLWWIRTRWCTSHHCPSRGVVLRAQGRMVAGVALPHKVCPEFQAFPLFPPCTIILRSSIVRSRGGHAYCFLCVWHFVAPPRHPAMRPWVHRNCSALWIKGYDETAVAGLYGYEVSIATHHFFNGQGLYNAYYHAELSCIPVILNDRPNLPCSCCCNDASDCLHMSNHSTSHAQPTQ